MKTVLITGAGRGLGRALAEQFHANGWQVVATDISSGLLTDLEGIEGYFPVVMDVASDDSVNRAFTAISRYRKLRRNILKSFSKSISSEHTALTRFSFRC
jgi:NAD(P)-dependent dehydrogenase (short-subunit alcohol dehydrogenase family)